jgi:hypothetical protein
MKLFTRKEVKAAEQNALEALRLKESEAIKALNAKTQKLDILTLQMESAEFLKKQKNTEEELEQRIKRLNEIGEIEALEERRKNALRPIEEEYIRLEMARKESANAFYQLIEKEREIARSRERLSAMEAALNDRTRAFENLEHTFITEIADLKRDTANLYTDAKSIHENARKERERAERVIKESVERLAGIERAELMAKAAIAAADARIALERKEQAKTDDKRRMLGVAIAVAKKKNIWPVPGIPIK